MAKRIFVTGCAGFIGSHLCEKLLDLGYTVYGIDILNDYYDTEKKLQNLQTIKSHPNFANFTFLRDDLVTTNVIT
jgi:UDP-glucuronate 4-epimerase